MAQTHGLQTDALVEDINYQRETLKLMKASPLMAEYNGRFLLGNPEELMAGVSEFGKEFEKARDRLTALCDLHVRAMQSAPTVVSAEMASVIKDAGTDWDAIGDRVKRKQRRCDILEAMASWEHTFKDKKGGEQVSLKNQSERLHDVAEHALEAHKQLPPPGSGTLAQWEAALESAMPGEGAANRLREAASAIERGASTVVKQSRELVLASEFGWDALEVAKKKESFSRKGLQEARDALDKSKDASKVQDSAKRARDAGSYRGRGRGRGRGYNDYGHHYENYGGGMVPQQGRGGHAYGGYNNSWGPPQGGIQKQFGGRGSGPHF